MSEHKRTMRCCNGGCVIPLVAEHRRWPKPGVRFYWCHWCAELFACVGEDEFGGRFAASFSFDQNDERFTLWKSGDCAADVELAREVIADVGFRPFGSR